MTRRTLVALAGATALTLAACGGSGGSDPPVAPTCPTGALASGAADATFTVAGWSDRDYDLVLPASHVCGQPIAVIVALHGGGSNKEGMRKLACLDGDLASGECLQRVAAAAGMAVVFANGTDAVGGKLIDPNGVRTWNAGGGSNGYICVSGSACTDGIDDVGYFRALLADVATRAAIDPKRVFVTGMSNGAAMSHRLACQAADVVAAIASVEGENQFALAGCMPSRAVAVLDIHGTSDTCWPYPGGNGGCLQSGLYVSVESTLAGWAPDRSRCAPPSETTLAPIAGVNDGTSVVRHDYPSCAVGGALEHLEVVGNGHCWPRGYAYASGTVVGGVMSRQLMTDQAIVDFFAANGR